MSELALQTVTPSSSAGSPVAASHTPNTNTHTHTHTHAHAHTPKSHKASKSSSASASDVPRFRPRACARCSISKLKCNWPSEPGEAPCERCARSRSECVLPSLKPRGPRRGNPTRVGQLEQKIDGIMSLLTASKHISKTGAGPGTGAGLKARAPASAASATGATSTPANSSTPSGGSRASTPTPAPLTADAVHIFTSKPSSDTTTKSENETSMPTPENYILASSDRAERWGSPPSAGVPSASSQSPDSFSPYQQQQQQAQQQAQQQHLAPHNNKLNLPPLPPSAPVSPAPTSSSLTRGDRAESTLPPPSTPSQFSQYRLPQPQPPLPTQSQLQQQPPQRPPQRPPSRQYLLPPYPQPLSVSPRSPATSSLLQHPHFSASSDANVTLPPILSVAPVASAEQAQIDIAPGLKLSYYDGDAALSEYRRTYMPHFPFVPIPPNVSAYDLSRQHPLLFRVIVLAVYPQSADANVYAEARLVLREEIAQRVVARGEASVELLQSILLYVAWLCELHGNKEKPTPLLQLAVGIVHDLNLDERAYELDETRSVLGCFYACSMASPLSRRIPIFAFSQHMADCCDRLLAARDYQSDELVVALVRVCRVAQRIDSSLPGRDAAPSSTGAFAPVSMIMAAQRKELTALADSQPPHVRQNSYFWVHLYSVMIRLYETALYTKSGSTSADSPRTEALWSCMQATTDYFDAYTSIPSSVLGVLPMLVMPQFSYCTATLTRLLELDDADWNQDQVRRCIDVVGLTQQLEDHLRAAGDYAYRRDENDGKDSRRKRALDSQINKMYWLRTWYIVKGRKQAYAMDVDMDKKVAMPDGREMSVYDFDTAFSLAVYEE